MKTVVGLDIECADPYLKTRGYSWKYNEGKVLCTALYYEATKKCKVIAGLHYESKGTEQERQQENEEIISLLKNPNVSLVGANITYDIGWLLYEYGMKTSEVKCSLIDVIIAEHFLDEDTMCSLDDLSWQYLKTGKKKERIEEWVKANVTSKGDFRQHLENAPWELLEEYVKVDAANPVLIWRKQLTLLLEQDLCKRVKLEFDIILPSLQMTMYGLPFDTKKKKENYEYMKKAIERLHEEFIAKYNLPSFRVTATRDVAAFLDKHNIPYKYKITLTGKDNQRFCSGEATDKAYMQAKRIVTNFRLEKGSPVAYIPKEMAERTVELLKEEGFMCNASPNLDKKFRESAKATYPEVALIDSWKRANDIVSKILGEKYDRYVTTNFKGEPCLKPQFKTADTKTHRFSSVFSNSQQIPSKNSIFIHDEQGNEVEVSFPKMTRALFTASKGCVFGKIDQSQLEYRLICNIACGEAGEEVRRKYNENPSLDFHQYTVDLTGLTRKYAKNMSFGVAFGLSTPSMAESFGWTIEHAQEIAEQYHKNMPFVKPTCELIGDVAKKRGYIKTAYGARARLKDKKKSYTMLNRYTQESGAEVMKCAMKQSYQEGLFDRLKVANCIHDEFSFPYLEPTEEQMRDLFRMAEIMSTALPSLRIPLMAEPELGDNWNETKEISQWLTLREANAKEWINASAELKKAVQICEKIKNENKEQRNGL